MANIETPFLKSITTEQLSLFGYVAFVFHHKMSALLSEHPALKEKVLDALSLQDQDCMESLTEELVTFDPDVPIDANIESYQRARITKMLCLSELYAKAAADGLDYHEYAEEIPAVTDPEGANKYLYAMGFVNMARLYVPRPPY